MKKRKRLSEKKKRTLVFLFGLFLFVGVIFSIPSFFKNIDLPFIEQEPEIEVPKLQILNLDSKTRPIAVMINNHNQARKYHAGLQDAYMVYEMIVEGGLTRMMALYKDITTLKIGSIRSARHYYLDYALEHDAIFVHWGYSDYAMNDMRSLNVNHIDGMSYGTKYFWKDTSLKVATEHTAFSSMNKMGQGIHDLNIRNTTNKESLLQYSIDAIDLSSMEGAILANQVIIKYSGSVTTSYEYDSELLQYKRSVNGTPHMDYEGNFQYTAKNIITYQVRNTTISGDEKGRQDLSTVGKGDGYFISNGYAVPITWEKKSRTSQTVYKFKNGTELKVNDGNTYIQIQPVGQTLTIS